jgi:hypothetical protein
MYLSRIAPDASNLIHVTAFVGCCGLVTDALASSPPAAPWPGSQEMSRLDALPAGMQAVETTVRHDHSKSSALIDAQRPARPNIGLLFGLLIHSERTIGVLSLESETTKTITPICMSVISMGHDLVRKAAVFSRRSERPICG